MAAGEGIGDGMSMREKALLKRRMNKQHNSNFKAGYVPINETYLHKTGLRGRKSYIVYGVVALLFLVALGNLMVTVILLNVLRIGYGMESLEFIPSGRLLRFLVPTELASVLPVEGQIGGFAGQDLQILASRGEEVELDAITNQQTSMKITPDAIQVENVNNFQVVNPNNGKIMFSSDYTGFGLPVSVRSLNVQRAKISRISSPINKTLTVTAESQIKLLGSEGVHMEGKEVVWTANKDVFLKSVNGTMILSGQKGVSVSFYKLPVITETPDENLHQFKICVCKNNLKLFRIPLTKSKYTCYNAVVSGRINPCL